MEKTDSLLDKLELLPQNDFVDLCDVVQSFLILEPNVIELSSPINICGDIHGQFDDLLELFKKGGLLPDQQYLFLGDFVDRGYNSVETIQLLFSYKAKYPKRIHLIRGNHESKQVSKTYGFYDEVKRKYGNCELWEKINETFEYLPIAAIIDQVTFCVHGGLSPFFAYMEQIHLFDRFCEITIEDKLSDLLWSDPEEGVDWETNPRGAGWLFGKEPVKEFFHLNDFTKIVRSHQLVMEGMKSYFDDMLVTIWSAPNYCYRCGNKATIMRINGSDVKFEEIEASTTEAVNYKTLHPYFL